MARYPGVEVKVREFLRKRAEERGDGHVTTAVVTEGLGSYNRTTVASAIATLARRNGTGVSNVAAGLYRYTRALDEEYVARKARDGVTIPAPGSATTDPGLKVSPATPPEAPVVTVASPISVTPADDLTRAGTPRLRRPIHRDQGLRALRFLREHPNEPFSLAELAREVGSYSSSSLSAPLRKFAEDPSMPVYRIMPGTLYVWRGQEVEQDEPLQVPEPAAPEPVAEPAAPVAAPEPAPAPAPAPAPEPAPKPAAPADDNMVLLEKLAETEPGKWLSRDADGQIFWLEKLR